MNGRLTLARLVIVLVLTFSAAPGIQADPVLSDAAKKEAVYQMYAGYKNDFPEVADLSPQEAIALQAQDAVVFIDTRKPGEMAVSTLPGAVTKEEFVFNRDRYAGKTAIAFCTIGYRSGVFARDMASIGRKVVNLRGGILAWTLEGGTVYDDQGQPTRRVHVYGDKWDYPPEDWESVKFGLWQQIF
jgi:sodium/bile acid cotransporter 7